jgi:phage shock protein PspC (stress-responsive transcriptional regulator)
MSPPGVSWAGTGKDRRGTCAPGSMAGMTDLVRPVRGRIIAGVCAGLALRFNTSPTLIRIIFLLSMLLPGPQILIYIALWVIMPKRR